jgi:galactokinase
MPTFSKITTPHISAETATDKEFQTWAMDVHKAVFSSQVEVMAKAGGRVNLIGEHVDYPDRQFSIEPSAHLYSMGGAVQNHFLVTYGKRADQKISISHFNAAEKMEFEIDELIDLEEQAEKERHESAPERSLPPWANHTLGCLKELVNGGGQLQGLDLGLCSNVPHGSGMSNSAANCVAVGLVLEKAFGGVGSPNSMDLVHFARRAENSRFVGGHCGTLDQTLIVASKANMLTQIDYGTAEISYFPSHLPKDWQFITINTNVPHVLAESDYGHRVQELDTALDFLSQTLGQTIHSTTLSQASLEALMAELGGAKTEPVEEESPSGSTLSTMQIEDILKAIDSTYEIPSLPEHEGKKKSESFAILLQRIRHQKRSSLIVPRAAEAAKVGQPDQFGAWLSLEGQSLRMSGDFQITGENGAQDALLDAAFQAGQSCNCPVYGRMLGGGGGGNVLLFTDRSNEERYQEWKSETLKNYEHWTAKAMPDQGIVGTCIEPVMSEGARYIDL